MKKIVLILALMFAGKVASAGITGIDFNSEEVAAVKARSGKISDTAANCLTGYYKQHTDFFKKNGYSKFFGDRYWKHKTPDHRKLVLLKILYPNLIVTPYIFEGEEFKKYKAQVLKTVPDVEKQKELLEPSLSNYKKLLAPVHSDIVKQIQAVEPVLAAKEAELKPISCVGLTLTCLSEGFEKAGMKNTWKKIYSYLTRPDQPEDSRLSGVDLQKALIDLGWRAFYWNIDPTQNAAYDAEDRILNPLDPLKPEKKWDPTWGNHEYRHAIAMRKAEYYGIPLHDRHLLVGFKNAVPGEFRRAPFFLGNAHAGYHVFSGFRGQVIEAHSKRELNSPENLENSPFNPGDQEGGGGPRYTKIEKYRSGVIVVPPGYLQEQK